MRNLSLPSFYRVYRKPADADVHGQIGAAVSILCASQRAAGRQLRFFEFVLLPAILHKQFVLLVDEDGEPAAYVAWASVTEEVEQRIARTGRLGLHFSEWDEGDRIWIVDIAARRGHLKHVLQFCRDDLFKTQAQIAYMRLWRERQGPRYIRRGSFTGCLRSMPLLSPLCRCGREICLLNTDQPSDEVNPCAISSGEM